MTQPRIIVISAPSGGGKTTLIRALLEQKPNLAGVITHTTRPMREGEVHDVHYHFVDAPTFEKMIQQEDFVEWAKVYDQYYGTSKAAIEKVTAQGQIPIINLDWQGAENLRRLFPKQVLTIFILPPDLKTLEARLIARGDSNLQIQKRLALAEAEIQHSKEYDHVILNDNFADALESLSQLAS